MTTDLAGSIKAAGEFEDIAWVRIWVCLDALFYRTTGLGIR